MATTILSTTWLPRGFIALAVFTVLLLSGCESSGPRQAGTPTDGTPLVGDLSPLDESKYLAALDKLDEGDEKRARNVLKSLAKKYNGHVGVRINLASALYKLGDIPAAESVAREALALNNTVAEVHNLLGLIAVEEKAFKKAETEYLLAVTLDKKLANAHYNLALLYDIYFQDIDKAYQSYQNYLGLRPDDNATQDWVDQLKYSLEQAP